MSFRLVPKLVTLNDLELRNGHYFGYFIEFGSFGVDYIKVVEDRPILSATKVQPKESSFLATYHLWRYSRRLLRTSALLTSTCAISIHFAIHCEDRVQHIKMLFATYGRAMLDVRSLCGS